MGVALVRRIAPMLWLALTALYLASLTLGADAKLVVDYGEAVSLLSCFLQPHRYSRELVSLVCYCTGLKLALYGRPRSSLWTVKEHGSLVSAAVASSDPPLCARACRLGQRCSDKSDD